MISALIGCAALTIYAVLKVIWAVGGDIGVRNSAQWQEMLSRLTEGQLFGAFWGTVLLDVVAAVLLVAVAVLRPSPALLVRAIRLAGWLVGCALTLAGGAGLAVSLGPVTDLWISAPGDPGPLADWVFILVYGSFLVTGLAFLATTALSRPANQEAVPTTVQA